MYAIIQTGGRQEKVAVGDELCVEKLVGGPDAVFDKVLLWADGENVKVGRPYLSGARVVAQVLGEVRAAKVISFKFRRRKSSRRTHGHRQTRTRVKITAIEA